MSINVTLRTTKGDVTFDADECELMSVRLADGTTHEIKQPHVSNYFGNKDLQRKAAEQAIENLRETDEMVRKMRGS